MRHIEGRNEDSVKILGLWHFCVSRNPRNLRPGSSSLVYVLEYFEYFELEN